jgi:hypothetical protein
MEEGDIKRVVSEAVKETMLLLGVQIDDPTEVQKDFAHLRKWRVSVESATSTGMLTVLGVLITGALGALWMGLLSMIPGGSR